MSTSRLSKRVADAVLLLGTALMVTTCGSEATGPGHAGPAALMQIVSGDNQSAQAGTELPAALVVKVLDAQGRVVSGQVVNFRVTSGGGSVFAGVGLTNDSGVVRERWTLGTSTADSQRVEARAIDTETGGALTFGVFSATALPGPAAAAAITAGDSQSGPLGAALPESLSVRVVDRYANPVSGQWVRWSVVAGGGSLGADSTATGTDGVAKVSWSLGARLDTTHVAQAVVGTVATLRFTATPQLPSTATITKSAGDVVTDTVGHTLPVAPSVTVRLADGRPVAGVTVTFAVDSGGGSATGTSAMTNASGVATVGGWTLGTSVGSNQLRATVSGLPPVVFTATGVAGSPAKLGFSVQPSTTVAGIVITPVVQVAVQDAYGNTVTGSTASITVAITSGTGASGAVLGGTLTQTAVAGVATFAGLTVDKVGTGYTLTATATGPTDVMSNAFDVTPGAPAKLAFTVQPSAVVAGAAISPAVEVTVQDAQGNAATVLAASISVTLTPNTGTAGAHLGGTTAVTVPGGVATFASLSVDSVGTSYTLTASAPGLPSATSSAFAVNPGAAAKLAFTVQPSNAVAGVALAPAVRVTVQDVLGNTVPISTASIALTITSGTGTSGAVLGGTLTQAAVAGVATFADLTVQKTGTGYTLTAAAAGLTGVTSTAFNVTADAATKLAFAGPLSGVVAGVAIAPAVQVAVQDQYGNTVTGSTANIAVAITNGTGTAGAVLGGTLTRAAVGGVATFADLTLDSIGTGYTLTATSAGLAGAISNAVDATSPLAVSGVTPADGRVTGGTIVTITGTGFVNVTAVSIGGVALGSLNVLSSTQLTGVTPASASVGSKDVVVASSSYGTATCTDCFSYHPWGASISAGSSHTCGLTTAGMAYCWGYNDQAQLGDGTTTPHPTPMAVAGGLTFQALSAGGGHTCGLTAAGMAYCWGSNLYGQLGDGTMTDRSSPEAVAGGLTFQALSAGGSHTCGLTAGGAAYCWGSADALGDGTWTQSSSPVAVAGGLTFQALSAGGSHTCGLTTAGMAYCWGRNQFGALGDSTGHERPSPVAVAGGLTFQALSAGSYHTCGVTTGGAAYCWGLNSSSGMGGELGDGTLSNRYSPVAVAGGLTFQALGAGRYHTCGLTTAGIAYCWGYNGGGQLGDGTTIQRLSPVAVAGGLTLQALRAGFLHTCGLTAGGAAYCWGFNAGGQLGDGSTTSRSTPVAVVNP